MDKERKIFIAGNQTFIGSAIREELVRQGYRNLVGLDREEPDLTDRRQVDSFFALAKPDYVFLVAGKSGGIAANQKYPADLMRDNLLVECHAIHCSYLHGVKKLLYLASSCSYPKNCPQPMREEFLLTGLLEPTNEAYALAKIAGIKLCQAYRQQYGVNFIAAIPANAFGPGDDFSEEDSHVVPGLIRRMHEAKRKGAGSLDLWGTGTARREFIFVGDLAEACIWVMERYEEEQPINIGVGSDISIEDLARLIQDTTKFQGEIHFDSRKPDGMPRKLLDNSKLQGLQWKPQRDLPSAIQATYEWFVHLERLGGGPLQQGEARC